MTSILTNTAAMAAVQTLRNLSKNLSTSQNQVSSGLRVQSASDSAAYWSISTTMNSDKKAIAAASDARGLGAAKLDTAHAGLVSVGEILSEFKAKLVTATESSVDPAQIQLDLDKLKEQVVRITESSSFSGENWLNTSIPNLNDSAQNTASIVSSFVRNGNGSVEVKSMEVDLSRVSLFNVSGNGLLQASGSTGSLPGSGLPSTADRHWIQAFYTFTGPMTFTSSDVITFDTVVSPGGGDPDVTWHATISKSDVNAALSGRDEIADANQMAAVLDYVYKKAGVDIRSGVQGYIDPVLGDVWTGYYPNAEVTNVSGANFQVVNVNSTFVGGLAGGLENGENYVRTGITPGSHGGGSGEAVTHPNGNFLDIDIARYPALVSDYLQDIETMSLNVTKATAIIGTAQQQTEMQSNFSKQLIDNLSSGVGRLIDTDMEEASARLSALQSQQQIAIRSLSIANSSASNIITLFQ